MYGFSALFKPISAELGFSRAVTSVAAGIGRFEGGIESPLTGWLADRYGPRWIILFGVFILGLGLILMYFINSLWAFFVVWGFMLGTGHNIACAFTLDIAITNWFVKKRGLAMSIRWVVSGLSGVLVLPLIAWLIPTLGWRMTCVIGGMVMLLVGLPLAWFFVKKYRPEYYGLLPDGATMEEDVVDESRVIDRGVMYAAEVHEVEFALKQAVRTPTYWLLIVAQAGHAMAIPAIGVHAIPFLTDIGIDPVVAAGIMAIMVLASIPARFIGGFLADRVKKEHLRFLMGGLYLVQAVGFTVFLLNQSMAMIYIWFVLYGFGHGAGLTLFSLIRARYFGRKSFGSVGGTAGMLITPVGIAAPIYLGWMYDTTGSYITAFTVVTAVIAFCGILSLFILPPRPPAQVTNIRNIM